MPTVQKDKIMFVTLSSTPCYTVIKNQTEGGKFSLLSHYMWMPKPLRSQTKTKTFGKMITHLNCLGPQWGGGKVVLVNFICDRIHINGYNNICRYTACYNSNRNIFFKKKVHHETIHLLLKKSFGLQESPQNQLHYSRS